MRRTSFLCICALLVVAWLFLAPSRQEINNWGNSPLYAQSLAGSVEGLAGPKEPIRGVDGKGGGIGQYLTIENTCAPTCSQTTCGTSCAVTCGATCSSTCGNVSCEITCVGTCAVTCAQTCASPCGATYAGTCSQATCQNTCSQQTCQNTCVVTCAYTCPSSEITLLSFSAQAEDDRVNLFWSTASEIDNYYFLIRRSLSPDGGFSIISQIPSQHIVGNNYYSITDFDVQPGVTYFYTLTDVSMSGVEVIHPTVVCATPGAAAAFPLMRNYPNPFNQGTIIRFTLPYASKVTLAVFDVNGNRVTELLDGWKPAGLHEIEWEATDAVGRALPSGIYFYRLWAGDLTGTGKMVLVK